MYFVKNNKEFFLVIIFFVLLTIFFTFPLVLKINTSVYGPFFGTDVRGAVWFLWWLKFAFTHGISSDFCSYICSPFGFDASSVSPFLITFNLSKWLTILTNPLFFLNITLMAGFVLSGFFTYLLVRFLTKSRMAALLSGVIFAFSPYHLNKIIEFSFVFHGCWIALFSFLLLKLKNDRSIKTALLASFVFFIQIDFNIYFAYFLFIFSILFLIFCVFYHWREKAAMLKTVQSRTLLRERAKSASTLLLLVFLTFLIAVFLSLPSLFPLVKKVFLARGDVQTLSQDGFIRSFDYLFVQSARPLSYLLPASTHPVFGSFTKKMFGSFFYGRGSIEQTLYLGWLPILLSLFAFKSWVEKRRKNTDSCGYQSSDENFLIGFFTFAGLTALITSFPPFIDLGIFKIYFPSYFLYKILPMFRAYARIGVIVSLCVSVLAGFGAKFIFSKIGKKWLRYVVLHLFLLIVLFEFINFPPTKVTDISRVSGVYSWLAEQPGDFIIAEYPIALGKKGEARANYDYLYYQTFHHKKLLNGCPQGARGYEAKLSVLEVDNSKTPSLLSALGIKYIILHRDLYRTGEYKETVKIAGVVPNLSRIKGYKLVKSFDEDTDLYEVTAQAEKGKNENF